MDMGNQPLPFCVMFQSPVQLSFLFHGTHSKYVQSVIPLFLVIKVISGMPGTETKAAIRYDKRHVTLLI